MSAKTKNVQHNKKQQLNQQEVDIWPLIIIGFGPAGYNASLYASRYKIKHLVIGQLIGGQISKAHLVENYLGFPQITGPEIAQKFREHAKKFMQVSDSKEVFDTVTNILKQQDIFVLQTASGKQYKAYTVILAIGTKEQELGLPNEKKFIGRGVSYCATCDGFFFRDKVVGVVGGSDTANTASLYLVGLAKEVHQFVRSSLKGERIWHDQIKQNPKIKLHIGVKVEELIGAERLEAVKLSDGTEVKLDGLFVEIGSYPDLSIVQNLKLETDERGYIKVNSRQETNLPGFYAAGDITTASNYFRQLITSAAEGAIAANSVLEYLSKMQVI